MLLISWRCGSFFQQWGYYNAKPHELHTDTNLDGLLYNSLLQQTDFYWLVVQQQRFIEGENWLSCCRSIMSSSLSPSINATLPLKPGRYQDMHFFLQQLDSWDSNWCHADRFSNATGSMWCINNSHFLLSRDWCSPDKQHAPVLSPPFFFFFTPLGISVTRYTLHITGSQICRDPFHRLDLSLVPTLRGCSISAAFISQLVEASYQQLWRDALRQSVSLISPASLVSALPSAKTHLVFLPFFSQIIRKAQTEAVDFPVFN